MRVAAGPGLRMRAGALLAALALLAGCGVTGPGRPDQALPGLQRGADAAKMRSPSDPLGLPVGGADPRSPDALTDDDLRRFLNVVDRVEPVAEAFCRGAGQNLEGQNLGSQNPGGPRNCNLRIAVDSNPDQPANAYQTLDGAGRPLLVFSLALIAQTRNEAELAFVMGHEAGHHIAGHIPARERTALRGAMLAGVLATAAGGGEADVQAAQRLGAEVGARRYSKEFELEADRIGTAIAVAAGYDPVLGARFFNRLPDPGDQFLGSHPANAERQAVVAQTMAQLTGQ